MRFSTSLLTAFLVTAKQVVAQQVPTDAPTAFYENFDYDCEGCVNAGFGFCPLDAFW
jgi:hypothetical protein